MKSAWWDSKMSASAHHLGQSERGTTSVEFGLTASVVIVLVLGIAEFALAYWQWNAAAKAAQLGARLAAVSDPVDSTFKNITGLDSAQPGDPMPAFDEIVCHGGLGECNGESERFDREAMEAIVYGPNASAECPNNPGRYPPMCRVFSRIKPENVVISYSHSGLGFAGRPGGPVPTITLRLEDVTYDFILLHRLFGSGTIMPDFATTVTGESLSSTVE